MSSIPHPYTRALLSAIPSLRPQQRARVKLEGDPQSPVNPSPIRCRFCGRCPMEVEDCDKRMPALRTLPDGRQVRCHLAELSLHTPGETA
ncbi:MAG: oligopeptide/dipeptide ABC transporter ATP-binding protein [Pararhodobacter sp.]